MVFSDAQRRAMLARAGEILGTPWHAGGRTVSKGMDCLGVLLDLYAAAGITLPDVLGDTRANELAERFEIVDGSVIEFGDVARWVKGDHSHVGVAIRRGNGPWSLVQGGTQGVSVHAGEIGIILKSQGNPPVTWYRYKGAAQ